MVKNFIQQFFQPEQSKVGLALGGGAVLGAAHIGVLRAFEERKISIDAISGTSIGAFVGALYAFGLSTDEIEEIAVNLKWLDVAAFRLSRMGLLSLSRVQRFLEEQLGAVEFGDANIPLAVVATDVGSAEKIVLQSGELAPAVVASMSLPGIFQPVEYDGRMLVDGGLLETVPISSLPDLGATYIIGVNVIAKRHYQNPENIIELLANAIDITMNNVTDMQTVHADLLIVPELSAYNPTDTKNIPKLIQVGYQEACRVLDGYFETKKQGP